MSEGCTVTVVINSCYFREIPFLTRMFNFKVWLCIVRYRSLVLRISIPKTAKLLKKRKCQILSWKNVKKQKASNRSID